VACVDKLRGLTDDQSKTFIEALWSKTDTTTKLPSETCFRNCEFLSLPEPEVGQAKKLFRKYALSIKYPNIRSKESIDELIANPKSIKIDQKRAVEFISEILDGTAKAGVDEEYQSQRLVDWDQAEVVEILEQTAKWWDANIVDLDAPEVMIFPPNLDRLKSDLSELIPLFAKVILPRLTRSQECHKGLALRIIREMEQKEFCPCSVCLQHCSLMPAYTKR
jgi:hypothetical protein